MSETIGAILAVGGVILPRIAVRALLRRKDQEPQSSKEGYDVLLTNQLSGLGIRGQGTAL
jgi:hypothetical protein